MYYIKNFLLYSLLGFVMESTLYKIINSKRHSGIFYGPITIVYGIGIIALILIDKYLLSKIKCNKYIKLLIEFISFTIILSLIELLCGNITYLIFKIDMWNYIDEPYHIGKYVCLQNSLIWGLLGVLYIHIFKPFTDKIVNQISKRQTYIFILIFIIDLSLVMINK